MQNSNLTSRDLAMIKRIAMNVDADYQKVNKLNTKIQSLQAEVEELQATIDEMEAPVIRKTGGLRSTDLYEKVVTPMYNEDGSVKTDKNGHPMKATKYVLKEKETPVVEEPHIDVVTGELQAEEFDCSNESSNLWS